MVFQDVRNHDDNPVVGGFTLIGERMSNVISVILALFNNPGIQALIKEIVDMLGKKPAAQGMAPGEAHDQATVQQAVNEVVARRLKI